ncbi:hypothetical protein wScaTNS_00090 [Wolbachia pipientis]
MEYIAKLTNATATVASRLIPSGVAAKTASGAKIEVEDTNMELKVLLLHL